MTTISPLATTLARARRETVELRTVWLRTAAGKTDTPPMLLSAPAAR